MEWKKYTVETKEETLVALRATERGLSQADAKQRLLEYGKNSIEEEKYFIWRILRRRAKSLLLWVLFVVALITCLTGDYFETFLILIFLGINISLEVYQEFHSERAARLLKHYLVSTARVWRDGTLQDLQTSLLVPGDVIALQVGDRIPADIRFLETQNIVVDESTITGESISIAKHAEALVRTPENLFGADNIGFAGTNIVAGSAVGVVVATATKTALGDVAHVTFGAEKETVFEKNVREFSSFLVKLLLGALALVFVLYFLIHGQSVSVLDMVLFTLVLAITVVPEALPTITTVALTRGSLTLAKKHVVVKRLSAIEDLGSIEILCTDKTGTLTENHLQVVHFFGEDQAALLAQGLLAAQVVPKTLEDLHDAFDKALYQKASPAVRTQVSLVKRIATLPFDPHTRMNAVVVEQEKMDVLIVRGAPEVVLAHADNIDAYTRKQIADWVSEAGNRGERVLALASQKNYDTKRGLQIKGKLHFHGLIAFLDPLKESSRATIQEAKALGVMVKIFSGDSKEVVGAVAYATGLVTDPKAVITGEEFDRLSLPEQVHTLEHGAAFARFSPEQKYSALKVLQQSHTVGFLGEGINDAPALKLAHVALVVEGASDIAREASDILLLKKDLGTIIAGIREGRRVFANILKYLKITLAANFGNFYSVTLATLLLPYLPLLPLQILLLNLLSDFPMLAIATDRVDAEKLERPNAHNMHTIVVTATLFGAISSFFDLTIFRLFGDAEPGTLQTAWFLFSLCSEILLLYSLRTRRWFFRGARSSIWVNIFSVLSLGAACIIPYTWFGNNLSFQVLSGHILLLLFGLLALYFIATEVAKRWYYLHSPSFHHTK